MNDRAVAAAQAAYRSYMDAVLGDGWINPKLVRLHEAVAVRKAIEAAELWHERNKGHEPL